MSDKEPFYLTRDRMLVKVKLRTEKHGDEDVNAYDVILAGAFPNAVLLKLDPDLRPHLYTQEQGDLVDGQTYNTLRFPQLGHFEWKLDMTKMELTLHDEEFESESVTFTDKEVDRFNFGLLPGSTVNFGLRVKVGVVEDEDLLIKLLRASHQELLISLRQVVEEESDNFEQVEQVGKAPQSEAGKELASLFSNPVGAQSPEELVGLEPEDPPVVE
jgi:hypothetical protein